MLMKKRREIGNIFLISGTVREHENEKVAKISNEFNRIFDKNIISSSMQMIVVIVKYV